MGISAPMYTPTCVSVCLCVELTQNQTHHPQVMFISPNLVLSTAVYLIHPVLNRQFSLETSIGDT